jgi:hypothetical protein
VEAIQAAVGKHVAGTLVVMKAWTSSERLTPCGPSVTVISGMPRRSTGVVVHGPAPIHKAAFSSNVIFFIKSAIVAISILFEYSDDDYKRSQMNPPRFLRNNF